MHFDDIFLKTCYFPPVLCCFSGACIFVFFRLILYLCIPPAPQNRTKIFYKISTFSLYIFIIEIFGISCYAVYRKWFISTLFDLRFPEVWRKICCNSNCAWNTREVSMKKIVSIILCCILFFCLAAPCSAFSEGSNIQSDMGSPINKPLSVAEESYVSSDGEYYYDAIHDVYWCIL